MPTSPARLAANRANAAKSTGPRTPHGKRRSSRNATTHGLLSLSPADQRERDALLDDLTRQHAPATPREHLLLAQFADSALQRARARQCERDRLDSLVPPTRDAAEHHRHVALALTDPQAQRYARYAAHHGRALHRALSAFHAAQHHRRAEHRLPVPPTPLADHPHSAPDETNPAIFPILNDITPATNPNSALATAASAPLRPSETNPTISPTLNEITPATNPTPPTFQAHPSHACTVIPPTRFNTFQHPATPLPAAAACLRNETNPTISFAINKTPEHRTQLVPPHTPGTQLPAPASCRTLFRNPRISGALQEVGRAS